MRQKLKLFWLNLKVDLTLTPKARKNLIKGLIIGAIALITPILIIAIIVALQPNYPFTTDSIEDYNNEKYNGDHSYYVFMPTLPENAEVVSYYSYNYWDQDYDRYLELKFGTREEMDEYLNALFEYASANIEEARQTLYPKDDDWFAREVNPYDSSFIDCYSKDHFYSRGEYEYTGYETGSSLRCSYSVISYSYDCLTVIQSYARGSFQRFYHGDYIPKFLERFGITHASPSHEIVVEFDRINKDE